MSFILKVTPEVIFAISYTWLQFKGDGQSVCLRGWVSLLSKKKKKSEFQAWRDKDTDWNTDK